MYPPDCDVRRGMACSVVLEDRAFGRGRRFISYGVTHTPKRQYRLSHPMGTVSPLNGSKVAGT